MFKLCLNDSGNCKAYKNGKFLDVKKFYKRGNGFIQLMLSNSSIFLHFECPMKNDNCQEEKVICAILPQTKIIATLTHQDFLKKKPLIMLNAPFIHYSYKNVERFSSDTLKQISNRCNLLELSNDSDVICRIKCQCGKED